MVQAELAGACQFFDGIDATALAEVSKHMRPRHFAAREFICRQGEHGDSLFVIQDGVAQVVVDEGGSIRPLVRLRRGDVVGEMSLVTDEPRSASVIATVPTDVLELDRNGFAAVLARHPTLLANLSRILSRRLARTSAQPSRRRGEAIAILTVGSAAGLGADVVAATRAASPNPVTALELVVESSDSATKVRLGQALAMLDDLLSNHSTVMVLGSFEPDYLGPLLNQMDRVVLLVTPAEAALVGIAVASARGRVEVVLVSSEAAATLGGVSIERTIDPDRPHDDVAWLGRHLARTKLGLALGAGGAKGYAHLGVLQVLAEAGYTVDCVAGTSVGAIVGASLAMGMSLPEIDAAMRAAFSAENVAEMFTLTLAGTSRGQEAFRRICHETAGDRTFVDLAIPFVAMAVDLNSRQPAPLHEGPVWEALVASTSVPGLFPPFVRDAQRLVDGLALVPVPTPSLREAGADVTIAVNLMSRETLPAWPGETTAPAPEPSRKTTRMLETLLEVMDLAQLDASVRHAALADIVITPRFGPSTWRDYHLADLFLAAGREAATARLASLRELARPQSV